MATSGASVRVSGSTVRDGAVGLIRQCPNIIEIEPFRATFDGCEGSGALRVTRIFRLEDDVGGVCEVKTVTAFATAELGSGIVRSRPFGRFRYLAWGLAHRTSARRPDNDTRANGWNGLRRTTSTALPA